MKEQTVEKLEKAFQESAVVYGMRFKNISVRLQRGALHMSAWYGAGCACISPARVSPGQANDVLSANFASWSKNIRVQEHIAAGGSRETGLGNHHTSHQGAFLPCMPSFLEKHLEPVDLTRV